MYKSHLSAGSMASIRWPTKKTNSVVFCIFFVSYCFVSFLKKKTTGLLLVYYILCFKICLSVCLSVFMSMYVFLMLFLLLLFCVLRCVSVCLSVYIFLLLFLSLLLLLFNFPVSFLKISKKKVSNQMGVEDPGNEGG